MLKNKCSKVNLSNNNHTRQQLIAPLFEYKPDGEYKGHNHPDFGSAWRQNDLDMLSSKKFRELLKKNDIQLVGWKEIKELMFP